MSNESINQLETVSIIAHELHVFLMISIGIAAECFAHHLMEIQTLTGCKPEQQMMYAGSKNRLVQSADLTKVKCV